MPQIRKEDVKIAYFSMEIAIENDIRSYAGGLGVLAGDTLKSACDLKSPMIGVTLLNNEGYFKQVINHEGYQEEHPDEYNYSKLKKLKTEVIIKIGQDDVKVGVWKYLIKERVPVYFLDTNIEGNKDQYRGLTGKLYGGDERYRLMQEIVLGRAGAKILPLLGYKNIRKYHLNEGHAALATVELFLQSDNSKSIEERIFEIQKKSVFTTHTPVKAGHDVFPLDMVKELQLDFPFYLPDIVDTNELNMTHLALYFSSYVNGVAISHQEVSKKMFPDNKIAAITNGVHSETWTSSSFKQLFDQEIPNWRSSSLSLRNAFNIPPNKIWEAHQQAKRELIDYIQQKKGIKLSENIFTIGFARRFTGYKRSTLLFNDMDELIRIHKKVGKMQIVYAGKAHPHDFDGKEMIKEVNQIIERYKEDIDIVFLENYDMDVAKVLIPGVDIWLNTPLPPNEASGTSGMKAAHNGVPHLSTLDGWWLEGFIDKKTGWAIGKRRETLNPEDLMKEDAIDLYYRLENRILPRYYNTPNRWKETMRYTIAINASFFNSERMLKQYIQEAYL